MSNTTSKGIVYPTSTDYIAPLETHFANLATSTNTALGAINAGTDITAGVLPIERGGTGGSTAATALASLGAMDGTSSFFVGKNRIINGGFDVWQRATSFVTPATGSYLADRWQTAYDGTGSARTYGQQGTPLGGAPWTAGNQGQFFFRYSQTAAGTGATFNNILVQPIEDVRTFAGEKVTVSFWAKSDATRSLTIAFQQVFGTGGTPSTTVTTNPSQWYKDGVTVAAGSSFATSTTFARYSTTVTLPSVSGKTLGTTANTHYLSFVIQSLALNTVHTIDIWGVQVEPGETLTAFSRAGVTPQGELQLCQRYYCKFFPAVTNIPISMAYNISTTAATAYIPFPVTMRIAPTALDRTATAGDLGILPVGGGTPVPFTTAASFTSASVNGARINGTTTTTVTAGQGTMLVTNSANGYVGFSAEY